MSASGLMGDVDLGELRALIEIDLADVVSHCQSLGVEPFGFAERAAARFATTDDFLAYDWRGRFPRAEVRFAIDLTER